jgi:hypothetical protein
MPLMQATLLILLFMALAACHGGGGGGSAPAITVLTIGVPSSDTVFFSRLNLYAAPTIPGSLYKISITNLTDDADLLVYGTDNTYTSRVRCAVDNTTPPGPATSLTSPEDCIMTAAGNTLYFAVDGTFLTVANAAVYTIDVEPVSVTNLNPAFPFADSVSQTTANAYSVPATAGIAETISLTGLTDDADLHVFGNDSSFTNQAPCSLDNTRFTGTTPEDCSLTSFGGTLFFIVDGLFSSAPTMAFTAAASPAPIVANPVNEGIIAPAGVQIDILTVGQVGQAGESFYVVNGLTPGTRYTVSITGLSGDADLAVYDSDSTFTNKAACLINNEGFLGIQAEDCTLRVSGSTLFFSVTAHTISGGVSFIGLVEPGP